MAGQKELFDSIKEINDIQKLVDDGIPETEYLDYIEAKHDFSANPQSKDRENNIAKIVCAMANSGGGIIIYGVDTDRSKTPEIPSEITGINSKNPQIINSVIATQINPIISGILMKPIPAGSPKAFLLYIPDSDMVPHQSAYDKLFYGRKSSSSIALDVHAIQQLFNERKAKLENAPIVILHPLGLSNTLTPPGFLMYFYLLNKGLSQAINVSVKIDGGNVASFSCLGVNERLDKSGIYINKSDAMSIAIEYNDIMNTKYKVIMNGGHNGEWCQVKPEIRLFKEGVQLI